MPAVERASERLSRAPNRGVGCLGATPRSERFRPHIIAGVAAKIARAKLNRLFEKLPLGHPQFPCHAVQLVEHGFIEPGGEDFLHT